MRCPNTLHGVILDGVVLEVKCRHKRCGAVKGVVVLHRFDLLTGDLIETKMYRDPV